MYLEEYKKLMLKFQKNIYEIQQYSFRSKSLYEKRIYQKLFQEEVNRMMVLNDLVCNIEEIEDLYKKHIKSLDEFYRDALESEKKFNTRELSQDMRQQSFTLEELLKYDGKGDNPAYIAVNGVVYDVTYEAAWGGATHMGLKAGQDLTSDFKSCHDNEDILKRLKVVGKLV